MDVFGLRENLIDAYSEYASSFIRIRDELIKDKVTYSLKQGQYWPKPLIQLNPRFDNGDTVPAAIAEGLLHTDCERIFLRDKDAGGRTMRFHRHQRQAIEVAKEGHNYILTTGTGSGKSLAYIVPIVDHVLRRGSGKGIQAIIVYPMNALVNSQMKELEKYLHRGFADDDRRVTFKRYTGQEGEEEREHILENPPDILLTNYVMLELIMTRPAERNLIERAQGLRFLVLDELHTYRGRQGADVALLMRRVRNRLETDEQPLQFVGTSATLSSEDAFTELQQRIADVGTQIFGVRVRPEHVIGETLQRSTPSEYDLEALRRDVARGDALTAPSNYDEFVQQSLSIWIEDTFGLQEIDGRLTRQEPRSIESAAQQLSVDLGEDLERCTSAIRNWLLAAYRCEPDPDTGHKPFAFRLHQFISPGDTVYGSLEAEVVRHITLAGQHFVPGDRDKLLFPLCFCRECGQEYYTVRKTQGDDEATTKVAAREFRDQASDDEGEAGYLYISTENAWSNSLEAQQERLPDDWCEEHRGGLRVRYGPAQVLAAAATPLDCRAKRISRGRNASLSPHPSASASIVVSRIVVVRATLVSWQP